MTTTKSSADSAVCRYSLYANGQIISGSGARHSGFNNKTKAEIAASEYADRRKCMVEVKDGSKVVYKVAYRSMS